MGLLKHVLFAALAVPALATLDFKDLDCKMKRLLLEKAKQQQPFRKNLPREVFDSLSLDTACGDTPPPAAPQPTPSLPIPGGVQIYVDASSTREGNGTIANPFHDIAAALALSRQDVGKKRVIVLRAGYYFLSETIALGKEDAGTTIMNYPGEDAWISGGYKIAATSPWVKGQDGIYSLKLDLDWVPGLFTLSGHRRLFRARYPNADPEVDSKGVVYGLASEIVDPWWRPAIGEAPEYTYYNLAEANPTGFIKNNSAMPEYNTYTHGVGGACNTVWAKNEPSFWCGNNSAGGWANVDQAAAKAGQLNLPVGMTLTNASEVARFKDWTNATGTLIHVWHSQSWFTNMFEVRSQDKSEHSLAFIRGGQQGGRNWCRCDQCSYAAAWCGQRQTPPQNNDTRMISGAWFVENVKEELDVKTEWFFNETTKMLYLIPNSSIDSDDLVVPQLKRLITITDTHDITIQGLGFRDAAYTYMDDWAAPSGGDWAIHRGGAVFIENAETVNVSSCLFKRLDGNAVFLSRRTRNVSVEANEFVWIGDGAMATWGDTDGFNATAGNQPHFSSIKNNYIHEIGLYEKQSSGWGQNKACQTHLEGNIMFNMPRAAINFNDGLGGANVVKKNFIWNTCRESGDHGPINTWDRMPFLTTTATGQPSFTPAPSIVTANYIIANYGGSQGIDNDDGSSFYHIDGNVFYAADGFKMDYGGHDSRFTNNLVVNTPYDGQNCFNVGPFLQGHGDTFSNNTCLVGVSGTGTSEELYEIGTQSQCSEDYVMTSDNKFFTANGTGFIMCAGQYITLQEAQEKHSVQPRSTCSVFPPADTIVGWAEALIQ
ncbi:hypothetical protein DIPPA_59763 [Diplonema papillatum]|nr:hypothetical protein DIPPA_59763 [Diplonema papillatum]